MDRNSETTWLPTGRLLAAWEAGRAAPTTLDGEPLEIASSSKIRDRWWILDGCSSISGCSVGPDGRMRQARRGNGVMLARADTIHESTGDVWGRLGVTADWMDYSEITRSLMISWTDPIESVAVNADGRIAIVEFLSSMYGSVRYGATVVKSKLAGPTDSIMQGKRDAASWMRHDSWYATYPDSIVPMDGRYDRWAAGKQPWFTRWFHSLPMWARVIMTAALAYKDASSYANYGARYDNMMHSTMDAWTWLGELQRRLSDPAVRRRFAGMLRRYGPIWLQMALNSMNNYKPAADDRMFQYSVYGGADGAAGLAEACTSLCDAPMSGDASGWTAPADSALVLKAARMAGSYGSPAACWPLFYVLLETMSGIDGWSDALGEELTVCLLLAQNPDSWEPLIMDLKALTAAGAQPSALSMMALSAKYRFRGSGDADLHMELAAGEAAISHERRLQSQMVDAAMAMEAGLAKRDGEYVARVDAEINEKFGYSSPSVGAGVISPERKLIEDGLECYSDAVHKLPSDMLTNHLAAISERC